MPLTIQIPVPHVPFGTHYLPAHIADADYLRTAAANIESGYEVGGSNVSATTFRLLKDVRRAIRNPKKFKGVERTLSFELHGFDTLASAQALAETIDAALPRLRNRKRLPPASSAQLTAVIRAVSAVLASGEPESTRDGSAFTKWTASSDFANRRYARSDRTLLFDAFMAGAASNATVTEIESSATTSEVLK